MRIIRSGDLASLRELSRYYYRINGNYRNNIDFLAHLPLYDNVIIPIFQEGKGSQAQILKAFYAACEFVDKLDLPNILAHVTTEWLITGIYYGILRTVDKKVTLQDLPIDYCRTRFKSLDNLNILEFNLAYFLSIKDEKQREEVIKTFPPIVQKAWRKAGGKVSNNWVAITPDLGGVCFCFAHDQTPLLIASIPELKKLDNAVEREDKRD